MTPANRIERNPMVMMGKPCVKGTRITVQLILERLAHHPKEELMQCYPELKPVDIQAALLYAANEMGSTMAIVKSGNKKKGSFVIGRNPVRLGISDLSENLDKYL